MSVPVVTRQRTVTFLRNRGWEAFKAEVGQRAPAFCLTQIGDLGDHRGVRAKARPRTTVRGLTVGFGLLALAGCTGKISEAADPGAPAAAGGSGNATGTGTGAGAAGGTGGGIGSGSGGAGAVGGAGGGTSGSSGSAGAAAGMSTGG